MYSRRLFYVALGAALMVLLVLAGVGTASAQGGTTTSAKISETEFKLNPATITVPANTPVQFTVTNAGTVPHNLKVELPAQGIQKQLFDQNLNPGETKTASFTFTTAGQWEMYCPVDDHEGAGMKGTVMVVAAQGAAAKSGTGASATAGATAGTTATQTGPQKLPVTGGELPISALAVVGLAALLAGVGLRQRRSA